MKQYTSHYIAATTTAPEKSCIDFKALLSAYTADCGWKQAIEEIFGYVASALFWTAVQRAQTHSNQQFFEENRFSCLEKPDYVQRRIDTALLKVMRHCCTLNSALSRNGYTRFLTAYFPKTDEGLYRVSDARQLALSIAECYENATGKAISDKRWLPYI